MQQKGYKVSRGGVKGKGINSLFFPKEEFSFEGSLDTLTRLHRKAALQWGMEASAWSREAHQSSETRPPVHSQRQSALETPKFRFLRTPSGSRLLTQHQHHLATQTVVDVQGLLAVVILLPIPGVGAHYRPRHYFRHPSQKQPENPAPKTRVAQK